MSSIFPNPASLKLLIVSVAKLSKVEELTLSQSVPGNSIMTDNGARVGARVGDSVGIFEGLFEGARLGDREGK
jgi:hypothetical protein